MHLWGFKRVGLDWWDDISFSLKNISSYSNKLLTTVDLEWS